MLRKPLVDRFERRIDYIRISVTDRCNFRCVYCMPESGVPAIPKEEMLTSEELSQVIRMAGELGMRKLRLTGGEPLLRKDLESGVRESIDSGFTDVSLTTNGFGLAERAPSLRRAGLNRINVSLDTLDPIRFGEIARRGDLQSVLDGIEASLFADLHPVKVNVVAMKGLNDHEALGFADWTMRQPVHIRFIELMPIRWNLDEGAGFDKLSPHGSGNLLHLSQRKGGMLSDVEMRRRYVSSEALKESIEEGFGPLEPTQIQTNGPARTFRIPGSLGTIGFISQISDHLCAGCNRLRLTADGFLRPCLMSDGELDLKPALRAGADLESLFRDVVGAKPERHFLAQGQQVTGRNMSQIGG